jgi:hypothetical protein
MSTLYFTKGDNKAVRTWTLRNGPLPSSSVVDLTNASALEIHAIGMPNPTMTVSVSGSPTAGTVTRTFLTADLAVAFSGARELDFEFETQVTFVDGTIATFPSPGKDTIHVTDQLA